MVPGRLVDPHDNLQKKKGSFCMSRIKNVEVFRRVGETKTDYIMYLEWENLRFSRVWGLTNDAKVDPAYVAQMFCAESQREVDEHAEEAREIGTPVDRPRAELGPEWEPFEY